MERKEKLLEIVNRTGYPHLVKDIAQVETVDELLIVSETIITEAQEKASKFGLHQRGPHLALLFGANSLFPELNNQKKCKNSIADIQSPHPKIVPPYRPLEFMKEVGM